MVKPYSHLDCSGQIVYPDTSTFVIGFLFVAVVVLSIVLPHVINTPHPGESTQKESPATEPVGITLPSEDALGITKDGKGFHLGDTLYRINETPDGMKLERVVTSKKTHSVIVQDNENDRRLNVGDYFSSTEQAFKNKRSTINYEYDREWERTIDPVRTRHEERLNLLEGVLLQTQKPPVSKE